MISLFIFNIVTKISLLEGERGIRTLGTKLIVQQISNLPLSTTQPPLHDVYIKYIKYTYILIGVHKNLWS